MEYHRVIRRPHTSEKGHEYVQEKNTYVFEVDPEATKTDIKAAVEKAWNVKVRSVRTINVPGKPRRYGRLLGQSSPWKKAIVRLADGSAIEELR
jgi:large subunit ribosomal protein L23